MRTDPDPIGDERGAVSRRAAALHRAGPHPARGLRRRRQGRDAGPRATKNALGKLDLPEAPADFLPSRMRRDNVDALAVTLTHALHVATLPLHHRDPFDRLLVAQASLEQIPIMTADSRIHRYDVDVLTAA